MTAREWLSLCDNHDNIHELVNCLPELSPHNYIIPPRNRFLITALIALIISAGMAYFIMYEYARNKEKTMPRKTLLIILALFVIFVQRVVADDNESYPPQDFTPSQNSSTSFNYNTTPTAEPALRVVMAAPGYDQPSSFYNSGNSGNNLTPNYAFYTSPNNTNTPSGYFNSSSSFYNPLGQGLGSTFYDSSSNNSVPSYEANNAVISGSNFYNDLPQVGPNYNNPSTTGFVPQSTYLTDPPMVILGKPYVDLDPGMTISPGDNRQGMQSTLPSQFPYGTRFFVDPNEVGKSNSMSSIMPGSIDGYREVAPPPNVTILPKGYDFVEPLSNTGQDIINGGPGTDSLNLRVVKDVPANSINFFNPPADLTRVTVARVADPVPYGTHLTENLSQLAGITEQPTSDFTASQARSSLPIHNPELNVEPLMMQETRNSIDDQPATSVEAQQIYSADTISAEKMFSNGTLALLAKASQDYYDGQPVAVNIPVNGVDKPYLYNAQDNTLTPGNIGPDTPIVSISTENGAPIITGLPITDNIVQPENFRADQIAEVSITKSQPSWLIAPELITNIANGSGQNILYKENGNYYEVDKTGKMTSGITGDYGKYKVFVDADSRQNTQHIISATYRTEKGIWTQEYTKSGDILNEGFVYRNGYNDQFSLKEGTGKGTFSSIGIKNWLNSETTPILNHEAYNSRRQLLEHNQVPYINSNNALTNTPATVLDAPTIQKTTIPNSIPDVRPNDASLGIGGSDAIILHRNPLDKG